MIRLFAVTSMLALLAACAADVGKDKVAAKVEAVPAEKAEAAVEKAAPAGDVRVLAVDQDNGSIDVVAAKVTRAHDITFNKFNGRVAMAGEELQGLEFDIDMSSIEADHPKLTEHLKDADFFDVKTFPQARFSTAEVTPGSDEAGFTHTIKGEMMMHGKSQMITIPAKVVTAEDGTVTGESQFVLNRQDFALTYPGKPDDLIQDNATLTIKFTTR